MAQTAQCFFFELADTFAAQAELVGDFFQRMRLTAAQAEAQPQNVALARREFAQDFLNRLLKHMLGG